VLAVSVPTPGAAQPGESYPSRPITVIVPQAVGGANDVIARILAPKLATELGQSVIVENKPGAGGTLGTGAAARAKPDGYTVMLTTTSAHTVAPALYRKVTYDPIKDFMPVATVATAGYLVVANPAFPASTMQQLIAIAKDKPGSISYASAGNGTLNHLIGVMIANAAGIELVHVPYKGSAAAATDVVSGQVPISVQSVPSVIGFARSGKLKLLAVANDKRLAELPEVPTVGETLKGFNATPWYGLFAPAGTPAPVVAKLYAAVSKALQTKEVKDALALQGCEPSLRNGETFAALLGQELPRWSQIVKASGATVD
jgi:tripartite-type tricarboxylate transporter receptor subunit TctC